MKTHCRILSLFFSMLCIQIGYSQTITEEDGNWSDKYVTLTNTSQAQLMVRVGDIDNLNFGWPASYNPFSGNSTPFHDFPWDVDSTDPPGTDRIMVVTSYKGTHLDNNDGYAATTTRPENNVTPITLTYDLNGLIINSVVLQIFVDDFEAPVWYASYTVTINDVRIPFIENVVNSLEQTGPIGELINISIPDEYLYLFQNGKVSIKFDDLTTGAGDGYAIDFVKMLINKTVLGQYARLTGKITASGTSTALESVKVVANGLRETYSGSDGSYTLDSIPSGIVNVQTYKLGYGSQSKNINLITGSTGKLDFALITPAPYVIQKTPDNGNIVTDLSSGINVQFNEEMDLSTFNDNNIIFSDRNKTLTGSLTKETNGFTFQPDSLFVEGMIYTVTITSDMKNKSGINLEKDYVWIFKTKDPSTDIGELYNNETINVQSDPATNKILINYVLENPSQVSLKIFNDSGTELSVIENGFKDKGKYSLIYSFGNIPAGVYFIKAHLNEKNYTRKLILE